MKQRISNTLTQNMQFKGLTKYKLAKLTGLQRTQLNSILSGKSNYTIDSLIRICKVLELEIFNITLC